MRAFCRPKSMMLVSCAVLAGLLVAAAPMQSRTAPGRHAWNRSGRRVALASIEGRMARPLSGTWSWFCSAREVRALALHGDTLWIGTEGGLFAMSLMLDVVEQASGPASQSVRALAVDRAGSLWVGGDHALSVRARARWRHYTQDVTPLFSAIRCIAPGEGRMWIGSFGSGMGYVAGDAVTMLGRADSLLDDRVLAVAEESPTTVYIGTASGLILADTSGWKSLRYGSRLPIGAVKCLAFDENGNLFCSIRRQGAAIYSFGRVRTFGTGRGTPGAEVNAFSIDPTTRRMWAAGGDGVFVFDGSEWAARNLRGLGAKKYRFLSMLHDAEGNCYLGTDEGSVVVVTRDVAREVPLPQAFPADRVPSVRAAAGGVWCIAGSSICASRGAFVKVAHPPELYAGEMNDFCILESGEVWAATRFGILRTAGRSWEIFDRKSGLPTEYFNRMARDPSGTLWFASCDGGVVSCRAGSWAGHSKENGLPSNEISDIIVDGAGNPWIVTRNAEVARFVQGIWERVRLPQAAPEPSDTIRSADTLFHFDPAIRFLRHAGDAREPGREPRFRLGLDRSGSCIIASEAGVYRTAGGAFSLVDLPERLRGALPTAVLGSSKGDLWLGTADRGLFVHRGGEWHRLSGANALSDDHVRSLCEDEKGNIWIGTQAGGLTRYTPPAGR